MVGGGDYNFLYFSFVNIWKVQIPFFFFEDEFPRFNIFDPIFLQLFKSFKIRPCLVW